MKVYRVRHRQVFSAEVERETESFYYIEGRQLAFDCHVRISKSSAEVSEEEALKKYIEDRSRDLEALCKKVEQAAEDVEWARAMLATEKEQQDGEDQGEAEGD